MKKSMKKIWTFLVTGISAFLVFTAGAAAVFADDGDGSATKPTFGELVMDYLWLIILAVLLVAWLVYSGFRRKKQVQEGQDMLSSLKPGAYVMTQGGLIGKVVEIIVISPTEKHVVLETGGEEHKSQITYDIRAIGMVLKPERLTPSGHVEEMVMPSEEEVQKRIDDIYAPVAAVKEEDVFDYTAAPPEEGKQDTREEASAGIESEKPQTPMKKTASKDSEKTE